MPGWSIYTYYCEKDGVVDLESRKFEILWFQNPGEKIVAFFKVQKFY